MRSIPVLTILGMMFLACGDISVPAPDVAGTDTAQDTGKTDTPLVTCKTHADCVGKVLGLTPCQDPVCDPDSWSCIPFNLPDGQDCNDQHLCTEDDWCEGGQCVGRPVYCNDDNPCTNDFCDLDGKCAKEPNTEPCEDGNRCTEGDQCQGGQCQPGEKEPDCDDGKPCTHDFCKPEIGCVFEPIAGCTEECQDATQCDDQNDCTKDDCEGKSCVHFPRHGDPCDDHNPCTVEDFCEEWLCVGNVDQDCDDGNPCTDDGCSPDTGCFHHDNNAPCNDGDACTTSDFCEGGECQPGKPKNCDDGDVCTEDFCSAAGVCPADISTPLDPGDVTLGALCCHVKCPQPNPNCTSDGCRCGNNKWCDPKYADTCKTDGIVIGGQCVCGKSNSPCPSTQCCLNGTCQTAC